MSLFEAGFNLPPGTTGNESVFTGRCDDLWMCCYCEHTQEEDPIDDDGNRICTECGRDDWQEPVDALSAEELKYANDPRI